MGSGNVATRLSFALKHSGANIMEVYSRNDKHAKVLADKLNTVFTSDLNRLTPNADLYILCLADDALEEVIKKFNHKNAFIVHTSGSVSIDIFKDTFQDYGVLYPLQTFSREKEIDFKMIPICIEANSASNREKLIELAHRLTDNVQLINSEQRRTLHLGAVFASNFTNYLYSIAEELLTDQNLSFDLLKPLIQESASKILNSSPQHTQTGPARRGDDLVIQKHLLHLKKHPEYENIYKLFSKYIKDKYSDR